LQNKKRLYNHINTNFLLVGVSYLEEKMICPNCSTQNNPGSKFCMSCGTVLSQDTPPEPIQEETLNQIKSDETSAVSGEYVQAVQPEQTFASTTQTSQQSFTPPAQGEYKSYTAYPPQQAAQPSQQYSQPPQQFGQAPQQYSYTPPTPAQMPGKPKKSNKALWIILGILGGLVIICVVLYFAVFRPIINKTKEVLEDQSGSIISTLTAGGEVTPEIDDILPKPTESVPTETPTIGAEKEDHEDDLDPGGDFPAVSEVISLENADRVKGYYQFGDGMSEAIALSADGKYIAVGTTLGVDIFDADSGEYLYYIPENGKVYDLAFLPEGLLLVSVYDGIEIYSADTFDYIGVFAEDSIGYKIMLSEDGSVLASDYYNEVLIYERSGDGYTYSHTIVDEDYYYSLGLAPDGKMLATGNSDGELKIWDVATGELKNTVSAHSDYINNLDWSPDSTMIGTASDDGMVAVFAANSGTKISEHVIPDSYCYGITFSHDNTSVFFSCNSKEIVLWNFKTDVEEKVFVGGETVFDSIKLDENGSKVLGFDDIYGRVVLWDYDSAEQKTILDFYNDDFYSLAVSPDGSKYFWLDGNDVTTIVGKEGDYYVNQVDESYDQILAPVFNKDGTILIGGTFYGYVNFRDAETGEELSYFDAHDDWIRQVAISPDESKIATASDDKTVKVWDYNSYELLFTLEGHTDYVRAVAFSPDGKWIASGGDDKTVRIWDANTGELKHVLEGHEYWVYAVNFTPDGTMLGSAGGDSYVLLWDPETGNLIRKIEVGYTTKRSLEFTPDSKAFWVPKGSEIELYSIDDSTSHLTLYGHQDTVILLRLSADGTVLVSASYDGTVINWLVE